ncbi:MAG: zinc-binding dehydrogenase [Acidimicrobiales bacterium]|nr:zinc-binding dehydrogenase [Acidimicrobiales bacterium]
MKALLFERKEARYVAAAVAGRVRPGLGAAVGPLRLATVDEPELPADDWVRVTPRLTGICGSDLATVEGRSSRYFEPFVSFPFIPGHEVVGDTADGRRVALEPVLGAEARQQAAPFPGAAPGDGDDYGYLLDGPIAAGIQIGFCADTGGGWGERLVAHPSQIHDVPDDLSDEAAVMLEPAAGGVHAAAKAQIDDGATVLVLGCGTMGLATIAALRSFTNPGTIVAVAKYRHQADFAEAFGADRVLGPSEVRRGVRRLVGCRMLGDDLSGGVDITVDAVGNGRSIADSVAVTRPRGRVVLVGMPGVERLDMTGIWHRETELVGAYTYGTDVMPNGRVATSFTMGMELVAQTGLEKLVSAHYPLDRWRDAITHAAEAGSRGAVKVVFDQRTAR